MVKYYLSIRRKKFFLHNLEEDRWEIITASGISLVRYTIITLTSLRRWMQAFCKRYGDRNRVQWRRKNGARVRRYGHKRGVSLRWSMSMDESVTRKPLTHADKNVRCGDMPILFRDSEKKSEKSVGSCDLRTKSLFSICSPGKPFLLQDDCWGKVGIFV